MALELFNQIAPKKQIQKKRETFSPKIKIAYQKTWDSRWM